MMKRKRLSLVCFILCIGLLCAGWPLSALEAKAFSDSDYDVISADSPGGFVKICAEYNGFGALDKDGKVYIFGAGIDNSHIPPKDLPPIMDLAMGNYHVVVLDRNGTVHAWGNKADDHPDFGQFNFSKNLPKIKAVAADGYKTLLLTEDGKVLSFGNTNEGEQKYVPNMPEIVAIDCSCYVSVALDKNGDAHAWKSLHSPLPKAPVPISKVCAVSFNALGLGVDGKVYGKLDQYADMGNLSYQPMPELRDIQTIAGKSYNVAAIDSQGSVVVWGYYTNTSDSLIDVPRNLPPIQDIAFTTENAIALGVDGKLYIWGRYGADDYRVYTSGGDGSPNSSGNGWGTGGTPAPAPQNTPQPVTTAQAVSAVNTALQAMKTAGATSATAKLKNPGAISLEALQAMSKAAGATPLAVYADSMTEDGKSVDVRIRFAPLSATKAVDLFASTTSARARSVGAFFEKWFNNRIFVISCAQQGNFGMEVELAVKIDPALNTKALMFYSYNKASNAYMQIVPTPEYGVDTVGYLHFTTGLAGDILITDKAL